jgi:hypothetical protein
MPALKGVTQAEERAAQNLEVVGLGFLLAAYRAENRGYPDVLADLVPEYTPHVPLDHFSGKPLVYKRQENGYLLYSVGVNGKDDGGLSYADRGAEPGDASDYDDLAVQVPLKQREQERDNEQVLR